MDNIKRNSSDSDLSDDWNVIDVKDAPPFVSESESIEVIEEDDDDDNDAEVKQIYYEKQERAGVKDLKKDCGRGIRKENSVNNSDMELLASRTDEVQLVDHTNIGSTYYCVFPEELHNVFNGSNFSNVNASEVMCSISLILLCTVASSFMVISTDNLMPSFLDVLVWQSLPDNLKDVNINNPGLISEQLKMYKNRNEMLENKLNHLKLAVKAYEENMVSEAALVEFVIDLQSSSTLIEEPKNEGTGFIYESVAPKSLQSSNRLYNIDDSNRENVFSTVKKPSLDNKIQTDQKEDIKIDVNDKMHSRFNKGQPTKFTKLLLLFNSTSDSGLLLNKASLLLLNIKDQLATLQKVKPTFIRKNDPHDMKLIKMNNRMKDIENKIDLEIDNFFTKFSNKLYRDLLKFNQNINIFICKNIKNDKSQFKDSCEKNNQYYSMKNNVRDCKTSKNKQKNVNPDIPSYGKINKGYINNGNKNNYKMKSNKNIYNYDDNDNLFKTDGGVIDKNKINLRNDFNENYKSDKISNDVTMKRKLHNKITNTIHNNSDSTNASKKFENKPKNSTNIFNKKNYEEVYNEKKYKNEKNNEFKDKNYNNKIKVDGDFKNQIHSEEHGKKSIHSLKGDQQAKPNTFKKEFKNLKKNSNKLKNTSSDGYLNRDNKFENFNEKNIYKKSSYNQLNKDFNEKSKNKVNKKEKKESYQENKNRGKIESSFDNKQKNEFLKKMTFDDINKFKKDVLNSIHSYIDNLLMDFRHGEYEANGDDYKKNYNSTIFSRLIPGDWFLSLGQKRSEIRAEKKKSEWLFDRAEGRHNLRDHKNYDDFDDKIFDETMWFFRRAWERNRFRY